MNNGSVIDLDTFCRAIKRAYKFNDDDALQKFARQIIDLFDYNNDHTLDNVLEDDERDVFYTLEENQILRTETMEIYIKAGKLWRIHYWVLNKKKILELAAPEAPKSEDEKMKELYMNIFSSDVPFREDAKTANSGRG